MKYYISGKITGDPDYQKKFFEAETVLREQGHSVYNPARLPEGWSPGEYMSVNLPALMASEVIYLLPDWRDSPGARIEFQLAVYAEKRIHPMAVK